MILYHHTGTGDSYSNTVSAWHNGTWQINLSILTMLVVPEEDDVVGAGLLPGELLAASATLIRYPARPPREALHLRYADKHLTGFQ